MPEEKRPLKVFLSHAHSDADAVHALYERLTADGVDAWQDKERLLPGQDWELEIRKAVREADVVVVCLSKQFNQAGYRQKEVRIALNEAEMQPEGEIFIIPARLEECDVPESLKRWHWVELFEIDGYAKLMRALKLRARSIGAELRAGRGSISDLFKRRVTRGKSRSQPISATLAGQEKEPALMVKSEPEKSVPAKSVTPLSLRPEIKPGVRKRKPIKTEYIVAIIGAVATIIAGILGSPWIEKWFTPIPSTTAIVTLTHPLPASTSNPTEFVAPTVTPLPFEITDSKGVTMRLIPAGSYTMGSDKGDSDEKPPHQVELDAFYMDKYEVTNALYKDCVEAGECSQPKSTSHYADSIYVNHPVVYVDWNQAKTYCEWRSGDLPTEAQWEKAARDTDERTYPWGEGIDCNKANYRGCVNDTTEVGSYEDGMSPYRLYDMAGNVWEWTADWYDAYPGSTDADSSYGTIFRVLRGGAWSSSGNNLRVSYRNRYVPVSNSDGSFGFRCVRNIPEGGSP